MCNRGARIWAVIVVCMAVANGAPNCDSVSAVEQAQKSLASKQYAEAATALDRVSSCGSLTALQTFQVGWLYGRARHFDRALELFDKVPAAVPDRATHAYAVGLSEFELGKYAETIGTLEPLRQAKLGNAETSNLLAVAYSKSGKLTDAYAVLAEEIQADPKDLEACLNLITVCAEGGDFAAAARIAGQAAAVFPQSAEVWIALGAARQLQGKPASAFEAFAKAAAIAPERPDARFFEALSLYQQGKYQDGVALLKSAKQQGVENADLDYLRAECLLKTAPGSALAALNAAIKLDPDSVAARTLRGRLLLEENKTAEALADLVVANQHDPNSRSAIYNLARAYRAAGNSKAANELFAKLRSAAPDTITEVGHSRLSKQLSEQQP